MDYNILNNIRKNNLKTCIVAFLFGILPVCATVHFFLSSEDGTWFMVLIFGALSALMIWLFTTSLELVINPRNSNIFKKYGSLEKLESIMKEIEDTIEFEDRQMFVAKNYVADKKDFERIIAYNDILRVHKQVHKTNFVIDRYSVVITDKYNYTIAYSYPVGEEQKVDRLIFLIGSKCNNAKLGYTKEAEEHIKMNREELPKEIIHEEKEEQKYMYACPDCNDKIEKGDKFCKN